jgi:Fic family protein
MALSDLISKITTLQQALAGYQPLPADVQEKLNKKFRLEFNYNSNHIEGNTLTYGETELFLIFDKTTGNHEGREYDEMRASDAALKMIQEYAADNERPLTELFIKDLNKLILVKPYWANAITPDGQPTRRLINIGDYKSQPNSVRLQNGEMFHYASPEETPAKMGELIDWYRNELQKSELHPLALAALLHYNFVRIHPFDDGNGRISRLLMNYVLYKHDLPPVIIKSANKKDYLFALNQADSGNLNAFVEYVATQMLWSLEIAIKAAKGESIEEQDDLEKEISVWKRELQSFSKHPIIAKSDSVFNTLYVEQLRPLLVLFEQKMSVFNDVFNEWASWGSINSQFKYRERGLSNIDSNFNLLNDGTFPSYGSIADSINSIELEIKMRGYKMNLRNPFELNAKLEFIFNRYLYEVNLITPAGHFSFPKDGKTYSDILTQIEQQQIVSTAQKNVFEYIKSQTETQAS